jgi:hypothetical protein
MIVVAVVGLVCAAALQLRERRERFDRITRKHWHAVQLSSLVGHADVLGTPRFPRETFRHRRQRIIDWHREMARKYGRAARYPWLPVAPDPSAPE